MEKRCTSMIVAPKMIRADRVVYVNRLPDDSSRSGNEDETVKFIYLAMAIAACHEEKQKID